MSRRSSGDADDRDQRTRSADERERARQEREARRAAREGREPRELPPLPPDLVAPASPVAAPEPVAAPQPEPVAPEPEPSEPPPVREPEPQPVAYEPPPAREPEPEPVAYQPEPVAYEPPPAREPEPEPVAYEPEPVAYEPSPAREPEPVADVPEPAREPEPVAYVPAPATAAAASAHRPQHDAWAFDDHDTAVATAPVVVHGRSDSPAGVKRVAASALASAAGAEGPPRYGAPPRGVPKRRRGARRVLPLLALGVVVLVGFFLFRLYQPGTGDGEGQVAVKIPEGIGAEQIGDLLAERGVVASGFFFSLRARLDGGNLRSGDVSLRRGMSYAAALSELGKAPKAAPVLAKVTLAEGPGRKEFAATAKEAGLRGSYLKASERSAALDPRDYGAPRGASLEGFLFPATYELEPGSTARALVTQQVRAFKRQFALVDMAAAKRAKLSRYDVLVIASMIEREALVAKDRRLISGVVYNRLEQGMPLGIDATIRYELDNFSRPLRVSELERDTPYNTRTRTGLPPGPIGNPGLASIRAAARPARNDFVYYVVKPCQNGAHAFSATDAQFQRDVAAYNAKREELGGKDPSQC